MVTTETITYSLDTIDVVAKRIIELFPQCHIFTFSGPLGAGKTTLIQAILRQCGVKEPVISPTFMYVQTYRAGGKRYHHFDLYRIASVEDFTSSGFEEYLSVHDEVSFIEWPEVISEFLGDGVCSIKLDYKGASLRQATIKRVQKK